MSEPSQTATTAPTNTTAANSNSASAARPNLVLSDIRRAFPQPDGALEVLRVTSERAAGLSDWGRLPNREAKTAEAKALYEDLLPRMERELVR